MFNIKQFKTPDKSVCGEMNTPKVENEMEEVTDPFFRIVTCIQVKWINKLKHWAEPWFCVLLVDWILRLTSEGKERV